MKKKQPQFDFTQFEDDLNSPPSDLWLRHLATDERMVMDFQRYLNVQMLRAQAHAVNLRGPEMEQDLLRIQGGVRVLATMRNFVQSFLKQGSESLGRAGLGRAEVGASDARRSERVSQNGGANRG